ncbi:PAS domain-containing protein [Halomonas sp. CH40]
MIPDTIIPNAQQVDYQTLAEHHPFMLNRFLPDTTLVFANRPMAAFFGVTPEAMVGQRWLEACQHDEQQKWLELYPKFTPEAPRHRIVNQVQDADGQSRWVEWINTAFFNAAGEILYFQGVGMDVTQRVTAQNQLQENEARYSLAQKASSFGIWDWYPQRDEVFWDDHCYRMLGLTPSDIPLTFASWQALLHPDDLERCRSAVHNQLEAGDEFIVEFRYQAAQGYRWVQGRGQVVERDAQNNPTRLIGVHLDIHTLKETQLELTRSNEELEHFAYAVSHDLRQPLRMVNSYLQLLTQELGNDLSRDAEEMIGFAREGAERMDAMILGILNYSRVGRKTSPLTWVDSREVVDEVLSYLKPKLQETGGHIEVRGDWPEVYVSRDELVRLLQNLLHNALKYVDENTTPRVIMSGRQSYNCWHVTIKDNGIGIAPDQQNRLFRVFSRLQPRSRFDGTGIGLAVCKRIAEHHGGHIDVDSQGDGYGSCFRFSLPIYTEPLTTQK